MISEVISKLLYLLDNIYECYEKQNSIVQKLIAYIEENKKIQVQILKVDYESKAINGIFLHYDSQLKVIVSSSLNREWKRFVVAKEILSFLFSETGVIDTDKKLISRIEGPDADNEARILLMTITLFLYEKIRNELEDNDYSYEIPTMGENYLEAFHLIEKDIKDHLKKLGLQKSAYHKNA